MLPGRRKGRKEIRRRRHLLKEMKQMKKENVCINNEIAARINGVQNEHKILPISAPTLHKLQDGANKAPKSAEVEEKSTKYTPNCAINTNFGKIC